MALWFSDVALVLFRFCHSYFDVQIATYHDLLRFFFCAFKVLKQIGSRSVVSKLKGLSFVLWNVAVKLIMVCPSSLRTNLPSVSFLSNRFMRCHQAFAVANCSPKAHSTEINQSKNSLSTDFELLKECFVLIARFRHYPRSRTFCSGFFFACKAIADQEVD